MFIPQRSFCVTDPALTNFLWLFLDSVQQTNLKPRKIDLVSLLLNFVYKHARDLFGRDGYAKFTSFRPDPIFIHLLIS